MYSRPLFPLGLPLATPWHPLPLMGSLGTSLTHATPGRPVTRVATRFPLLTFTHRSISHQTSSFISIPAGLSLLVKTYKTCDCPFTLIKRTNSFNCYIIWHFHMDSQGAYIVSPGCGCKETKMARLTSSKALPTPSINLLLEHWFWLHLTRIQTLISERQAARSINPLQQPLTKNTKHLQVVLSNKNH